MKKYRIIYWIGSARTDFIVSANDEDEAVRKFVSVKGEREIVRIVEV